MVGAVWLKIFDKLVRGCPCPVPAPLGQLEDFDMPLRVDCNCNVFVTCCDGTEKQILTSDQVKALVNGQPGSGTTQPEPGGCHDYPAIMQANGKFLVPVPVSTGDTVEIIQAVGAGNDGAEIIWHCPDGTDFFAGECASGSGSLNGADPLPTVKHMTLLININGTFYNGQAGPITVPGGVSLKQPFVQVNDAAIADNAGEYTYVVRVCNNQLGTFTHTFDFTLNTYGWIVDPSSSGGAWVASAGFQMTTHTGPFFDFELSRLMPARDLSQVEVFYAWAQTASSADGTLEIFCTGSPTSTCPQPAPSASGSYHYLCTAAQASITKINPSWNMGSSAGTTGTLTITKIVVHGTGVDPF
jgi:hypothetical protein